MVISKKDPQPSSEKVSVLLPPKKQQQQRCGKASAAPARRPRRGKGAIKEDGPCAGQRLPAPSAGLSGDKGHPSINPSLNPSVHPSTRPSAPHGPAAASGPGAARGLHLAAPGGGCRRGPGPAPARSRGSPFPAPGIPDIPGTRHSRDAASSALGIPSPGKSQGTPGLSLACRKRAEDRTVVCVWPQPTHTAAVQLAAFHPYLPPSTILLFTTLQPEVSNSLMHLLAFGTCAGWGQAGGTVAHKDAQLPSASRIWLLRQTPGRASTTCTAFIGHFSRWLSCSADAGTSIPP